VRSGTVRVITLIVERAPWNSKEMGPRSRPLDEELPQELIRAELGETPRG